MRGDLGITYDEDVLRLIDAFTERGLYVGSVCITRYAGQEVLIISRNVLKTRHQSIFPLQYSRISKQYPSYRK